MPCVLLVLLLMAGHAAGQGLLPSNVPPVGASNSLSQLQLLYRNSKAWKSAYKQRPNLFGDQSAAGMCNGPCKSPNMHAWRGKFSSQMITSVWKAQQHIRQHGAVVSRFDLYSDFRSFFADKRNAQAVYRPSPGAYFKEYHAITLVGYDNEQQYWLAKNSYGSDWADKGVFKVAFGVCAILAADKGEAYGVVWTPSSVPDARQLPVTVGPRKDCYWYQAQPGDYLSKVAWLAGIRLDKFMLDNTGVVKDLDAQLQGGQLLLCNPAPGNVKVLKTDPQLEALLRVKAAIDTTGKLDDWRRAAGMGGGCCEWRGVVCSDGTSTVYALRISPANGIQGLKGTLPQAAAFDGLVALNEIGINDHPGIGGTMHADWSRLSQLQDIRLGNNSLTGSIPPSWGSLAKLRVLHLFNNKISGSIPASFRALTALEELDVPTNALSGTIPDLSSLTKLRSLGLSENKLSGSIPTSFKALTALQELSLQTNGLSGTIPDLSSLNKLRLLHLYENKLSGSIPASFRALTALEELSLQTNGLSGTIPDLTSLTRLQILYLYENKLSGSMPTGFRALTNLEDLDVSTNALSGTIPDLSSLTKLRSLGLSENKLSGPIPESLVWPLRDYFF
ncbi:hypothetical protein OEZ85_014315 [Tetradesmus obliquus]|uniref:LysM domain-containing protein n=1 Tax=Tetradesmus obliquus TaxID=3088 RepID=A0ABY8UBM2_TETOB|nr:hypothetical protein OEZ85_014315 [Tetradesmus obliquus]